MTPAIKPMLASPSTAAGGRQAVDLRTLVGTHSFDVKIDGLRAILYWDGLTLIIFNRSLLDITRLFPELEAMAPSLGPTPMTLDGEIVADDGLFTTVATRGKQTNPGIIARMVRDKPCKFIAFDLLSLDGQNTQGEPYTTRRAGLDLLAANWPRAIFQPVLRHDDGMLMWTNVSELGLEGLIAKRKDSTYQPGARSRDWLKFKTVRRVTCVAVGYEKGEGARSHFGAMHLAMIGPGSKPVQVGRVGTGFNDAEIWDLKGRIDRGELFLVEIEALNRTKDNQLRFPVYKGIRTDIGLADATLDQLDTLPLC